MSATYFQFPLCALAYGESHEERLDSVISWCVFHHGSAAWEKLEEEQQRCVLDRLTQQEKLPSDFDEECESHCQALYGASILNVSIGSIKQTVRRHAELNEFFQIRERRFGPDASVRIRSDLFWDAKCGKLPYREFAVLVAVYSVIGSKDFVRIIRQVIQNRAMGYKSRAACDMDARIDEAEPLTAKQVRTALDRLEKKNLFVRINPTRRTAYFSNRLNVEELADAYIKMKFSQLERAAQKENLDVKIQQAIEEKKNEIAQRPRTYYSGLPIIVAPTDARAKCRAKTGPLDGPKPGPQRGPLK